MPRQRNSARSYAASVGASSGPGDPLRGETRQSLDDRFSLMYAELRRLAASVKRNDPNSLVSTGTLVHEAWSKLARSSGESPQSELHFKSIAACAMRQILKDAARRRRSGKRGGGNLLITLDESIGVAVSSNEDLLRLDAALDTLAEMSPRQAKLVELRYYGGLKNSEIEALLGIGERTVERDWRAAKAWLAAEIRGEFR